MGISQQIGASSLIKPGVCTSTTRPASPFQGQCIFETDTNKLLVWNGTVWVIPNSPAQNPGGLELIKTQTVGSGVSSVPVTGVFSSTYNNYKIIYSGGVLSANSDMQMQLGPSSVSGYNTSYETGLTYGNPGTFAYAYSGSTTTFTWIGGGNATSAQASVELIGPNLARYTRMNLGSYQSGANFGNSFGVHYQTQQYTDITLLIGVGYTFTGGTISVYGYRK